MRNYEAQKERELRLGLGLVGSQAEATRGRGASPRPERRATVSRRASGGTVGSPRISAFTLIEILIVMGIIMIVAVMGTGAYSLSRRSIALDLESDRIVVILHEMRSKAQSASRCFGMRLRTGAAPVQFEAPYKNRIELCGDIEQSREMPLSSDVAISALSIEDRPIDELSITFLPPRGRMLLSTAGSRAHATVKLQKSPYSEKKLELRPATGGIEKLE